VPSSGWPPQPESRPWWCQGRWTVVPGGPALGHRPAVRALRRTWRGARRIAAPDRRHRRRRGTAGTPHFPRRRAGVGGSATAVGPPARPGAADHRDTMSPASPASIWRPPSLPCSSAGGRPLSPPPGASPGKAIEISNPGCRSIGEAAHVPFHEKGATMRNLIRAAAGTTALLAALASGVVLGPSRPVRHRPITGTG